MPVDEPNEDAGIWGPPVHDHGTPAGFTVKEMLIRVMAKLDQLDAKLDTKADAMTLIALTQRVSVLENAAVSRATLLKVGAFLVSVLPAIGVFIGRFLLL